MTDVFKGAIDQTIFVELVDSTTGLPKTGIVYTDVTGSYSRTRSARAAITMATLASASASHADGGFILVDDTNQPGVYRVDIPDAAFATGASEVVCTFKATGCRTVSRSINLVNINNQVAYVPNAAADAAGGLPISDAGGLDLDSKLANTNEVTAARMGALTDWINGGRLDLILDIIAADTTTDIPALIATLQAFVDTEVAAIKAKTDNLPTDPADQSAVEAAITAATSGLATAANLATVAGYLDTEIAAILADTNELQTNQGNWLTATGFSTHSAADVLTALGTGSWATSLATQASVDVIDGNVDLILADTGTDGVVVASGSKSGYSLSSAGVRAIWTDDWTALAFAADTAGGYVQMMATEIDGVVTKVAAIQDRVSYCLTVLVGACADAGTSAETYVHAIGGETFTVDYTGLDATGNRTTTTLSKV